MINYPLTITVHQTMTTDDTFQTMMISATLSSPTSIQYVHSVYIFDYPDPEMKCHHQTKVVNITDFLNKYDLMDKLLEKIDWNEEIALHKDDIIESQNESIS